MTNDEIRMTKESRNPNDEFILADSTWQRDGILHSCSVIRHSFVIRAWSFVIAALPR
jgi:hypothetical protein